MTLSEILDRARLVAGGDQILRHQLMWMLLLRVVLYTLLMTVSTIFRSPEFDVILVPTDLFSLLLLLVFLSTIFSAFFLLIYSGDPRKFGFLQTLLDTGFVSLLVFCSGSSQSIYTSVYFFPIIAGGLINTASDVEKILAGGAIAVSTSKVELWPLNNENQDRVGNRVTG